MTQDKYEPVFVGRTEELAPRVRGLTVSELAQTIIVSLSGLRVILIWDHLEQGTPTQAAWLNHFLKVATLVVATSEPESPKLKTFLERIPAKIKLAELSEAECRELIERCLEIAPFAISDPQWYRSQIWRKSRGHPRAIKDLLGDHALEKCVDAELIQSINTEQGVKYFVVSPIVLVIIAAFSVYRYVGLGLGDREAYIGGAAGSAIFLLLAVVARKLNAAASLADLAAIPGNRLEALSGDRTGQHSIRINDPWRICFQWKDNDAYSVEIVDYH